MPSYKYTILTPQGKEKKGSIEANDAEHATNLLKADGSIVTKVQEEGLLDKELSFSFGGGGVKARDLSVFCQQFHSITGAGVSIVNALEMLGEQTENKALRDAINNTRASVEKGSSLAESMKKESVFPSLLINMVEAGEASGSLETAFERMATHFEKDARLKALIKKSAIYPIAIIVVLVVVVIVMLVMVIPTFKDMFEEAGSELPWVTQALVDMSNFMINRWYLLLIIIAAIVIAVRMFASTNTGKYFFADLKIKLPVFGTLTVKTASAQFARTMSTLMAAGVPVIEALEIVGKTMSNLRFRDAIYVAKEQVAIGRPLSEPLKESGLFPPTILHMVGIGEETGNLEHMLTTAADYYDEEVENATEAVASIIEPMIIVVMAVIVGGVIMAIMMPMMSMYDIAGGSEV